MKITLPAYCFTLAALLICVNSSFGQDEHEPYNDEFKFRAINEKTRLERDKSLQALIVDFSSTATADFEYTLKNNPQLEEIQLFSPSQAQIDLVASANLPQLSYLIIEDYNGKELTISALQKLTVFWTKSEVLSKLSMDKAAMPQIAILSLDTPALTEWTAAPSYENLELIDLDAPRLTKLPFEHLPALFQCSSYCSLDEFPAFFCESKDFEHISLANYKVIPVPECLLKQLKEKGYYSNITLYDQIDGEVVKEWLSPDRED